MNIKLFYPGDTVRDFRISGFFINSYFYEDKQYLSIICNKKEFKRIAIAAEEAIICKIVLTEKFKKGLRGY